VALGDMAPSLLGQLDRSAVRIIGCCVDRHDSSIRPAFAASSALAAHYTAPAGSSPCTKAADSPMPTPEQWIETNPDVKGGERT
jgi:hypothetical protein